jgi:hypothetical protein
MNTLRRWLENIKWLFNHPPLALTSAPTNASCDYCGSKNGIYNFVGVFCVCYKCMKKTFDFVLKDEGKNGKTD